MLTFFNIKIFKKFFQNSIRVSKGLNLDQDRHIVDMIWVQTVCKGYQLTTKVTHCKEKVKQVKKPRVCANQFMCFHKSTVMGKILLVECVCLCSNLTSSGYLGFVIVRFPGCTIWLQNINPIYYLFLPLTIGFAIVNGPRPEKTCLQGFANNTGADQPAQSDQRLCYSFYEKYNM